MRCLIITLLLLTAQQHVHGKALLGRVALVTGASRGIGKGIALGLAEQGCTVIVTGRSSGGTTTDKDVGGTLENVVDEIRQLGGVGHALRCDHRNDTDVAAVFDTIAADHGRLDILVNNAFTVPTRPDGQPDPDLLFRNFWEQPGWFYDALMDVGLRSHYIASVHAVPLLRRATDPRPALPPRRPLIAHISSFGGVSYSFNVAYGVGKAGVDKMAKDMAVELRGLGISCVSVYPGVVRTERMRSMLGDEEEKPGAGDNGEEEESEWQRRTGLAAPRGCVETPRLSGRVLAALYLDEDLKARRTGDVCVVAELAKAMRVTDVTGLTPPSIRSLKFLIPAVAIGRYGKGMSEQTKRWLVENTPDILLPFSVMAGGSPAPDNAPPQR